MIKNIELTSYNLCIVLMRETAAANYNHQMIFSLKIIDYQLSQNITGETCRATGQSYIT